MDNSGSENILIVDDEASILEITSEFFKLRGYTAFTAENGKEALNVLAAVKIDCCFSDINMPEMDGLELAEEIRKIDNTIPVIIMTGYPSLDNTIQTLKNGVVDFLIKPVNLNQMEICLKRVLRERQLFVDNVLLKKEIEGKKELEKLNFELKYKLDELHLLNNIMKDFSAQIGTTSDVFRKIVGSAMEISSGFEASFYIVNESVPKPFEVAIAGSDTAPDREPNCEDECRESLEALIKEVASDGRPLVVENNKGVRGVSREICSLMVVPIEIRSKIFGVLTVITKDSSISFNDRDLYYLSFMTSSAASSIENHALYENIYENLFATLYGFVKALEARDPYTQQHSNRVTGLAMTMGRAMGCTAEEIEVLNVAGRLHDIGKIGIRDSILLKPGRLTNDEFMKIKEHPVIGSEIMGRLGLWDREKNIVRSHHERYDGKGYPSGLAKEEVPFLARILSVADVYDAVASDRAYRKRMEEGAILEIIESGREAQFDPAVVDIFMMLYHEGEFAKFQAE